ncbi:MAG: hypothetical protein H6Q28_1797 [Bacteroidetes bacterium]|nr:hypothetical protein [Bacteroidota bacterium]
MWCGAGFGAMVEHPLAFPPAAVTVLPGSPGSRSEIIVLAKDRPLLAGHVLTDEGILIETQTFRTPDRCGAIAPGDFNGDGKREFALLSAGGTRVHAYLWHPAGWVTRRLPPGTRGTKLLSADLNADGFGDVLCYGKNMAGGVVYFGSGTGLADSSVAILEDVSIADAVAADVNGDRVPDLLIADWLGNAITLFTGLDGLTFTEALKVDAPGEPLEVDIADAAPGVPAMLAVLTGNGRAIRTYTVEKAGEVSLAEEIRLDAAAEEMRLIDSDGNRRPELLVTTASGTLLAELSRGNRFGAWTTYGVFTEAGGISIRDIDGDRKRDLVAVEPSGRKLVVCANSSALLGSDGHGNYALERTVPIPEKPTAVLAVPERRGAPKTIVTSHALTGSVGVIVFRERGMSAGVRTIATADRPKVLVAVRDSNDALQVLVMTGPATGRGSALSWFDERTEGQFVERTSGVPPAMRIAHAVADGRSGAPVTIAAVVRDRDRGGLYAWTGRTMPSTGDPFSAVSATSTRLLAGELSVRGDFTVFFTDDAHGHQIGMTTYLGSQGTWTQPVLSEGLWPDIAAGSIVTDMTGDGRPDLLYSDRHRGMIVLLPGASESTRSDARNLLQASGTRAVAVGDIGTGRVRDLFVIHKGQNAVSMIRGVVGP